MIALGSDEPQGQDRASADWATRSLAHVARAGGMGEAAEIDDIKLEAARGRGLSRPSELS
jgi:hypothetical protein